MSDSFDPSKYTILVIDDEVALTDIICEEFKDEGYNVYGVYSATQAMELLKKHHFDLVLTDLIMPGTTGLELIKFVKEHYPSIKNYFVMTGFIDHSKSDIIAMGVQKYFTKPVLMEDVLGFAKELFD